MARQPSHQTPDLPVYKPVGYYFLVPILLALATALAYYPSLNYEFQFDDVANITKHFNIRHYSFGRLFFSGSRWISYWINSINYKLGKFEPFYYRLFNCIFHSINGLLVFFFILCALSWLKKESFFKKQALSIATVTALLFLLHPVQTQTVSYVIQGQLEGLACMAIVSMSFVLLLFARAKNYLSKFLLASLLFTLAILSCGTKEIAIISPALLLFVDWFFIAQGDLGSLKKRVWIHVFVACTVFGIYLYLLKPKFFTAIFGLQHVAKNNTGNIITDQPGGKITPWLFFISQFKVILHYLWIFVWPFNISVEYDWKLAKQFFAADALLPFLGLCSLGYFLFRLLTKDAAHVLGFALVWFFVCIAPRSSIIPSPELLVDYKTYTASIGSVFALAACLIYVFKKIADVLGKKVVFLRSAHSAAIGFLVLSVACCFMTVQRNYVWSSGLAFWGNIIKNAPGKARAYNNYGVELSQKLHKFEESVPYFKKAIAMDAHYPDPCNNLAVAYSQTGKIDLAIKALRQGLRINPYYPEGYNNLASFYVQQKKFDQAEKILNTAIKLRPYYGKAHFNLGRVFLEQGKKEQAWASFKTCCTKADLDNELGFSTYGKISMALRKYEDAIFAFTKLLEINPQDYTALSSLANAYYLNKNYTSALALYQKALAHNPSDARILYNAAETYLVLGMAQTALDFFARLKPLEYQFPLLTIRMAVCYEKMGNLSVSKQLLTSVLANNNMPETVKDNARSFIAQINKKHGRRISVL